LSKFCGVCGNFLKLNNTFGQCIECKDAICKKCGKINNNKVMCSECFSDIKKGVLDRMFGGTKKSAREWSNVKIKWK